MAATDALVMADDSTQAANAEAGQVKFTKDNESIDVNGEQKLIGLTKEQLERYRNDPVWKPIRYTLFALFWLVWIAMFAGAILIVVMSPKCAAKKEKNWKDNSVNYQIYTPTFKDSDGDGVGDFNGIKEKLNDLRRVGVTAVWPTPLFTTEKDDYFKYSEIKDSLQINQQYGTEDDLRALIKRAHDLNLYFIADLPLTISTDNPQAAKQGIGGAGKVRLLNLAVPDAFNAAKQTAAKLISLGVDGLSLAQYGLKYPSGSVDSNKLDDLAKAIRAENVGKFRDSDPNNFVFISESVSSRPTHAIDFHTNSVGHFSPVQNGCSASDNFIDCFNKLVPTGIKQIKNNASSLPLWELGDISHKRVDSLFGKDVNESSKASFLATAIQLFLPGAVKVYYGEELGLPSSSSQNDSQFGLMQWEDTNKGFTSFDGTQYFASISKPQASSLNFKTQYDETHSHLKVFKKLSQLRTRDEVFTDGEYTTGKIDGLHVFIRTLEGDDKAYILVANWPAANDKTPKQFAIDHVTKPFKIKAASAELIIDHPMNEANEWHIQVDSKLTLDPYEFVLVRVEVLA